MIDLFEINRFSAFYMNQYPGLTIKTVYNPCGVYMNYHIDNIKAGGYTVSSGTFDCLQGTQEALRKLNFVIIEFLAGSPPTKYEEAKENDN